MTSLSEAYRESRWGERDPRRVYAGMGVLVAGTFALVAAIVLVTTPLSSLFGTLLAREVAGILAGLGVPAALLGVVAVLPSSRREGIGVILGALISVGGVGLFWYAYPTRWPPAEPSLAFPTAMVYFLGGCLAFASVFSAVATYTVRNNPTGTVTLRLTRQGETRTVRVSRDEYRSYKQALRGDGGRVTDVIRDIESKFDE